MSTLRYRIARFIFDTAYGMNSAVVPGVVLVFVLCMAFVKFESFLQVAGLLVYLFCCAIAWELLALLLASLAVFIVKE